MASKWGLALLGLAGRRAAAETATNFGRQMLRQAAGGGSSFRLRGSVILNESVL